MTVLIAGGDSFTYGAELQDCDGSYSNLTWSALLAKRMGMSYCCTAKSCLLYTSPSPRDRSLSRMPSSA